MEEFSPVLELLTTKFGFLKEYAAAFIGLQMLLKVLQPGIARFFQAVIERVVDSDETDDDSLLRRWFSSRTWRLIAFFADLVCRLKLPGVRDLDECLRRKRP